MDGMIDVYPFQEILKHTVACVDSETMVIVTKGAHA
jgi:hypothetical protein